MTHLGKMLRLYRSAHSVEQQALAEAIGITPRQLQIIELGDADDALNIAAWQRFSAWLWSVADLPVSRHAQVPLMMGTGNNFK